MTWRSPTPDEMAAALKQTVWRVDLADGPMFLCTTCIGLTGMAGKPVSDKRACDHCAKEEENKMTTTLFENPRRKEREAETEKSEKAEEFETELRAIINTHSQENESNTPDYILARYMKRCLDAFNEATNIRESHYDVSRRPGHDSRDNGGYRVGGDVPTPPEKDE